MGSLGSLGIVQRDDYSTVLGWTHSRASPEHFWSGQRKMAFLNIYVPMDSPIAMLLT